VFKYLGYIIDNCMSDDADVIIIIIIVVVVVVVVVVIATVCSFAAFQRSFASRQLCHY